MAATHPKDGKLLYHLTAFSNLESILQNGLQARNIGTIQYDVADQEIIEKRKSLNLLSKVPFHFFPKSPFAGVVMKDHPHDSFVYITVHREFARRKKYQILTKHPLSKKLEGCGPFEYDKGMAAIDWATMGRRDYRDEDCKAVCMAECLALETVMPEDFSFIFVKDETLNRKGMRLKERHCSRARFKFTTNPAMFV